KIARPENSRAQPSVTFSLRVRGSAMDRSRTASRMLAKTRSRTSERNQIAAPSARNAETMTIRRMNITSEAGRSSGGRALLKVGSVSMRPAVGTATEVASERAGQPLVPGPVDMVAGQSSNAKVPRLGLTRNWRVDARIATTMMPPHAPVAELVDAPD